MSEQRGFNTLGPNPEVMRTIETNVATWKQLTRHLVDHTFEAVGHQMALGRRVAESKSITDVLEAQAEFGKRTFQTALDCGRKMSETGQNIAQEMAGQVTQAFNAAASSAQRARSAEEQTPSPDQARDAMKAEKRMADEAAARASSTRNNAGSATAGISGAEAAKPNGENTQVAPIQKQVASR